MKTSPNFVSATNLLSSLSDLELAVLVSNPQNLKEYVAKLVSETYFIPITDEDVSDKLHTTAVKWRKFANDLDYGGPVLWKVREGFTLKQHTPLAGPCFGALNYLQDWKLKNDEPTTSSHVFFIPRLVKRSTNKNVEKQMKLLADTRKKYGLPDHHLSNFGSAAMLCGLVLAHFKRTVEKTPLDSHWVRSDTLCEDDGDRLYVGDFDRQGLLCDLRDSDDFGHVTDGVFPLGVELD